MLSRIYLITNTINDKKYVGQTIKPIEKKIKEHFNAAFSEHRKAKTTKIIRRDTWGHI